MDISRDMFLMNQTYATLFTVTNKLQTKGDQFFESITSRQYMAMLAIAHLKDGEASLNNIAKKLGTTKQSTKHLITSIEQKGYVITTQSQQDKRAVNVKITDAGMQIMINSAEHIVRFYISAFRHFTTEELEILWSLLKKLYCFDGETQDGFEKDVDNRIESGNIPKKLSDALEDFKKSRYQILDGGNENV